MGWIKLHRKLTEWGWYGDTVTTRVFLHLLLTANYEPSDYHGTRIEVGQAVYGRKELGAILDATENQIRTALEHLRSTGEITTKTTNKFSVATIVKWREYQVVDDENHQQECRENPDEAPLKLPTEPQPITTSKNIRKEESKNLKKPFGEFGNLKMTDADMDKLRQRFPAIIDTELQAADGWIQSKGYQRKYTDWYAFLRNWCSKKQPKAADAAEGYRRI